MHILKKLENHKNGSNFSLYTFKYFFGFYIGIPKNSKKQTNFFYGFNFHHAERLRASRIVHTRNEQDPHTTDCYTQFCRASDINVSMKAVLKHEV